MYIVVQGIIGFGMYNMIVQEFVISVFDDFYFLVECGIWYIEEGYFVMIIFMKFDMIEWWVQGIFQMVFYNGDCIDLLWIIFDGYFNFGF